MLELLTNTNKLIFRYLMKSKALFASLVTAFTFSSAFAAPVVPGEYTDPSVLKKTLDVEQSYVTPVEFQFPYISTYYIKPNVSTKDKIEIGFYVTDWDHSLVRNLDDSYRFDVHLKVVAPNGKEVTRTLNSVKSGDGKFEFKPLPKGEYRFCVWAVDLKRKTESHRVWHRFRVFEPNELTIPTEKTYTMTKEDLEKYSLCNRGDLGRKVYVKVTEPGKMPLLKRFEKIKEQVKKYAEANPQKSNAGKIGYTIYIPTLDDKEVHGSFKCSVVVRDPGYDTNAVEQISLKNAVGLNKILRDKLAEGFKKVVLYPGTYRISAKKYVSLPSNMTFDLNGATLKQNEFAGDSSTIVGIYHAYDAHLINGTLEGDYYEHDYENSRSSEWPLGFSLAGNSHYSTVENIYVKDITGYGGSNSQRRSGDLPWEYKRQIGKFVEGKLDRKTGEVITGTPNFYTSTYVQVDPEKAKEVQVSKCLGYQGVLTRQWCLIGCWYDKDKKFISSETIFQYRVIPVPKNAAFLRITEFNDSIEKAKKDILDVMVFNVPMNCAIKNCTFDHCRCVGYAASAMKNMLFEGNLITRSGESAARCAYDAEDGWDMMHDVYLKNNTCRDNPVNNSLLTCAGHNFIFEGNNCNLHFWPRTYSPCVRNNNIRFAKFYCDSRVRSGYARVENNKITAKLEIPRSSRSDGWDYAFNSFNLSTNDPNGSIKMNLSDSARVVNSKFNGVKSAISKAVSCTFTDCKVENLESGMWSHVIVNGGVIQNFWYTNTFENCTFNKTRFHGFARKCKITFRNCTFTDCPTVSFGNATLIYENCKFIGGYFWNGYWCSATDLSFKNCSFKITDNSYIKLGTYGIGETIFDSCTITTDNKTGVVFCDLTDWRSSKNGDSVPGSITMRNCTLGSGIVYGVGCSNLKRSNGNLPVGKDPTKKLSFKMENNKTTNGAKDLGPMPKRVDKPNKKVKK